MAWISVRKELPPKFKNVLCYSKKGQIRITCVANDGKLDDYELESDQDDKWTHWHYLPSPPKKKQ